MKSVAEPIFEMLAALARSDTAFGSSIFWKHSREGVGVLLQMLALKVGRQPQAAPYFKAAKLQLHVDFTIVFASADFTSFLHPIDTIPTHLPFGAFVAAFSVKDWNRFITMTKTSQPTTLILLLTDHSRKVHATACHFESTGTGTYDVTVVFRDPAAPSLEISQQYDRIFTEALGSYYKDAQLLQQLCDYLLTHLDKPKPTDAQLARQFYTNRQKLKDLFRYVIGRSMYKWYMRKKLEATMTLISETQLSLAEIAGLYGFIDFWYYSALFEKAFGKKPSEVKRPPKK